MAYRELVQRLGYNTGSKVVGLYRLWTAHKITDEVFAAALVTTVGSARLRAAALADLGLSADLTARLGRYLPPEPTDIGPESDRLALAADTLIQALPDTPDPEARVHRLGWAEAIAAAVMARSKGIERSPHVTGWVRGISPSACPLCQEWAAGGATFPPDANMLHHKGCTCVQLIITR